MPDQLVARRVYRIGMQSLYRTGDGRWLVEIVNRSYKSVVEIPEDKAAIWRRILGGGRCLT